MLAHECCGETLHLLPERAVWWPRERMLIMADVHFGKAATFRLGGIPIPRGTTRKNLERLTKLIATYRAERLLVLGDLIHARAGYTEELVASVTAWRREHRSLSWLVVPGNHDRLAGRFPCEWDVAVHAPGFDAPPFRFCHEPSAVADRYTLSGHVHPCLELYDEQGGGKLRLPCFWFGVKTAVLPAFGAFTGMHPIRPRRDDLVFVVGEEVHAVPAMDSPRSTTKPNSTTSESQT